MKFKHLCSITAACTFAPLLALPTLSWAATVANPLRPAETAIYAPGHAQDIVVPSGFQVSVFASGLNQPNAIAFLGSKSNFTVYVLESGHGLPSPCNEQGSWPGGVFDPANPFTPDCWCSTSPATSSPGRCSNRPRVAAACSPQGRRSTSHSSTAFPEACCSRPIRTRRRTPITGRTTARASSPSTSPTGTVTPFITNLPTGDHPTEQLAFRGDGWIYWSQGSTTNSGVVGLDNGSGQNQSDIPCQDIVLSKNVFISSLGPPVVATSGYSPFGVQQPGATIPAFYNSFTSQIRTGVCDGATLRAQLNNPSDIQAYGWGHRNGYAIRFAPADHPLAGQLLVGEDGADERGARPSNGAPENCFGTTRTPRAHRSITAGRTATASSRRTRRCSTRSAGPDDSASSMPDPRVLHAGVPREHSETMFRSPMCWPCPPRRSSRHWRSRRRIRRLPASTSCRSFVTGRSCPGRRSTASKAISGSRRTNRESRNRP